MIFITDENFPINFMLTLHEPFKINHRSSVNTSVESNTCLQVLVGIVTLESDPWIRIFSWIPEARMLQIPSIVCSDKD